MDQALIRKAAEAMHEAWKAWIVSRGEIVVPDFDKPFNDLHETRKAGNLCLAEAALKVFYEHTRSQPREGQGVRCQDCGAAMTPVAGTPCWTCHACGRTV